MNTASEFLSVRVTHSLLTFFANAAVEVTIDMDAVGSGALQSGYFDFTWMVGTMNPGLLEAFTLRPEKFGAMGNRYDVFSETGEPIATIQDHKYAIFDASLTCDFEGGRLQINETTKSNLLGIVNLGIHREFAIEGSVNGMIEVEDVFGSYGFSVPVANGSPRLNAIVTANLILLTRAIAEHHRR